MHRVGRWEAVRPLDLVTGQWGPPYILDRVRDRFLPRPGDRWWRSPDGIWMPVLSGGAFSGMQEVPHFTHGPWMPGITALSQTGIALDSAYTFNSAGDAITGRILGNGKTLANIYFYLTASAGTAININDLNFELRNDNGSGTAPNRTSPTLHTSGSMDPNADSTFVGWHQIDPADFTLVDGTYYWACFGDADGNGTDFATILRELGSTDLIAGLRVLLQVYDTTNGFSTNPTPRVGWPAIILEFTDGSVMGFSASDSVFATSNTERKGLYLGGMTEQIKLWGMGLAGTGGNISGIELYDTATNPGGTTLASGTVLLRRPDGTLTGARFASAFALAKATDYRLVFTFSGANGEPRKLQIGNANGHTTVLRKARVGGATWYYAQANGTTDWANDDQNATPHAWLWFDDLVSVAGGNESFTGSLLNRGLN